MTKLNSISETDLKVFDNLDKLSFEHFILELGIRLQYEYSIPGMKYAATYFQMGEELWIAFKFELYELLCNKKKQEPKEFLK